MSKPIIELKSKGWPSQSDIKALEYKYNHYIIGMMRKWGIDCTVATLEDMYDSIIDSLIEFEIEYGRVFHRSD